MFCCAAKMLVFDGEVTLNGYCRFEVLRGLLREHMLSWLLCDAVARERWSILEGKGKNRTNMRD